MANRERERESVAYNIPWNQVVMACLLLLPLLVFLLIYLLIYLICLFSRHYFWSFPFYQNLNKKGECKILKTKSVNGILIVDMSNQKVTQKSYFCNRNVEPYNHTWEMSNPDQFSFAYMLLSYHWKKQTLVNRVHNICCNPSRHSIIWLLIVFCLFLL